jgi:putative ABC transport system permease protein
LKNLRKFFYPLKIAIDNLLAAKFRSFLTILGIIIGVAAVIVIMAVGASAQQLIFDQIQGVGSDLVGVLPGASNEKGPPAQAFGIKITTFKYKDFLALMDKNNVPEIKYGAAYVQGNFPIVYEDKDSNYSVVGTTHQFPNVQSVDIAKGRFFIDAEDTNLSKNAVLGYKIAKDYFGTIDPVGKKIKIGKENFTIVGVFAEQGGSGIGVTSADESVFVPLFTAQKILLGLDYLSFARFKVANSQEIELAKQDIARTMRIQHDIKDLADDDFSVRDTASALKIITQVTDILTYFLALIAGISLLVGGVGIMNIMLISVNERIREVGLRKALGAKNGHISRQFLAESISITLIGGLIGIALGSLVAALIFIGAKLLGYDWHFIIKPISFVLAVSVSAVVGLVFGLYPAIKASKVSPMEALRYE